MATALCVGPAGVLAPSAGADDHAGLAPADPASPSAERIADTYYLVAAFAVVVFLVVTVPLVPE